MPLTERTPNSRTSRTTHCTRQKPLRSGPSYIGLSSDENTTPPARKVTLPSQLFAAHTSAYSAKTASSSDSLRTQMIPEATNRPRSRLPRSGTTPPTLPRGSTAPSTLPRNSATPSTISRSSATSSTLPRATATPSRLPRSSETPARFPRSSETPSRRLPTAKTPRDSAVWYKSTPALMTPPVSPIRPLEIRKSLSSSKTSRLSKPLPAAPALTMSDSLKPQDGRSLIDASEPRMSISRFPALSATPSPAASSPVSPAVGRREAQGSRIPRATFWPVGRGAFTPRPVVARVAASPERHYEPPAESYSTVRRVRSSATSRTSISSTPLPQLASKVPVRQASEVRLVAIPAATRQEAPVEPAEQGVDESFGLWIAGPGTAVHSPAPAPSVPTHAAGRETKERGRKGFFTSSKTKTTRSKSRSRAVLEKMGNLVHRRSKPNLTVSAPIEGSFQHLDLDKESPFAAVMPTNPNANSSTTNVPAVPPMPAMPPLVPDRPPPPVPASPSRIPRALRSSQPHAQAPQPEEDVNASAQNEAQQEETPGADLRNASRVLRTLADTTSSDGVKVSFIIWARAFNETKILVNQTGIAVETAIQHARYARDCYREATEKLREINVIGQRLMGRDRT